jgi:shikimate kinase
MALRDLSLLVDEYAGAVLVYITGLPGSGKSTVCEELRARGYPAIDADDRIGAWISQPTGELLIDPPAFADRTPEFYAQNEWRYQAEIATRLDDAYRTGICFVGGLAAGEDAVAGISMKALFLHVDRDELRRRIMSRTNGPFATASSAVRVAQANRVLPVQAEVEEAWMAKGFEMVDGSRPLASVVDDVLRRCELSP